MRMLDRIVFVSDADSDSGQAIIARLAAEGARFILNSSSNGDSIRHLLDQEQVSDNRIHLVNLNLASFEATATGLREAAAHMGGLDVLIVNHQCVQPISVEHGDEQMFLDILNANAKTAFLCTQAAGKLMKQQESGKIIYIGSIHAEKPTGSSFAYSAARGAVQMLAREASLILGRYGIQVNHIQMGPVEGDHEQFSSTLSPIYDDYEYKVPSAVLGTYQDLADLVLYMSSDESRYLNGSDIRLDGGFLHHYLDPKMKKPMA